MKKFCIVFAFLFIIIVTAALAAQPNGTETAYLRMHVRANSDSAADQAVKYEVRDAVVDYLMPIAASCKSKEEAMDALSGALAGIEAEAERGALRARFFVWGARFAPGGRVPDPRI